MEAGQTPPPAPPPPAQPPGGGPGQPTPPPPAGPPVPPSRGTAGRRIGALILALVFAFAGLVLIIAGLDIADGPLCEDVSAGEALPEDGECFDISSSTQSVKTVLIFASGGAAALAFAAGLFYVFTQRGGRAMAIFAVAAIALGAVGIFI